MSKIRTLEIAQLMDWMLELIPVWERPVTCSMLKKALPPEYTVPVVSNALKKLRDMGVLYAKPGERDQTFYYPDGLVKQPDIQKIICKGISKWSKEIEYE